MVRAELVGRRAESIELDRLIEAARGGRSATLLVRGEPGVGKTALLEALVDRTTGCVFTRTAGVEAEMELAYAGLYPLCQPFLENLDRLPGPLAEALGTAFGLVSGPTPNAFLVGLAVLNLLADAAADKPLICLIDDAQWLDKMSEVILAFVAQRLNAEAVVMIIAVRNGVQHRFTGVRELELGGLDRADAQTLLTTSLPGLIDPRVKDRIVAEAQGNPLALLELPHTGAGHADGRTALIEESFEQRLDELPATARQLLTLAAAEPLGDPTLLWRAAEHLGLGAEAATTALESGLITFGTHIRFRHPLVRSTAYRTASASDLQAAHLALAEVTDPDRDPDRRAWHRAQASPLPDEDVAADLERSAAGVRERGGHFAAGAFLERAVELTLDPERRAERMLAAATARCAGGALDTALSLLDNLQNSPPDELRTALAQRLRGQIQFDQGDNQTAAATLLDAARQLEPLKPDLAQSTRLAALTAAIWAAGPDAKGIVAEVAAAVPEPAGLAESLLEALAARFTRGYVTAAPDLARALAAELRDHSDQATGHLVGGIIAVDLWDLETGQRLVARQERIARQTGALLRLQFALDFGAALQCIGGDLTAASRMVDEQRRIATATGNPSVEYGARLVTAFRGEPATTSGAGVLTTYAEAVLNNGLGRYETARDAAMRLFEQDVIGYGALVASELAEAASRTGDSNLVESTLTWLRARAAAVPTEWSRGIEARVGALLNNDEGEYRRSIECLDRTSLQGEAARSRLLYGEWLRREGRRADARGELRTAYDALTNLGLGAFAERARHELLATGETVRKRSVETVNELTTQEAQIAGLARDGLTNPEIAAQLFLSPRTVEWHLRKTFAKLGITSRRQLRDAYPR
ncbi:LuxR family transcriptional regulator [Kribbella antibiotica]|uniref:LuxR family transcriptional regulator n=1 Tax=Kribbella antibiotica TaxID=190195 RepID=A0A4R5A139_9ACTN|nr:LuxR family transcriptional regulator [Kribbella antibiotica]TDD63212.1 LuxR family transcriptional regulator [Kribbella antibiotica]